MRCKGKDWAANGKAAEAGSAATAGWKRARPIHLPLPPHGAAEPDRRRNCALQRTPSGPPGNSPLTWTHSRLLLWLIRRSDFYGSTPSSSGFMVPSATSALWLQAQHLPLSKGAPCRQKDGHLIHPIWTS